MPIKTKTLTVNLYRAGHPVYAPPVAATVPDNQFSIDLLDRWVRYAVLVLHSAGVRTYESCQGGHGHAFPEPTVRFEGAPEDAFRAVDVARAHGLPVYHLRQFWAVTDTGVERPAWEMTFYPVDKLRRVQRGAERSGYQMGVQPPR